MPRRWFRAALAALAIAAIGGVATFGTLRLVAGPGPTAEVPFAVGVAPAPYVGFGTARIGVGGRCVDLLVAADARSRRTGLRGRVTTAPYAGMLFAFPADSTAGFTMSGVSVPLAITWYAADGRPVDRARMEPCPEGSDAECPVYGSDRPFRYALEQVVPAGSAGALGPC